MATEEIDTAFQAAVDAGKINGVIMAATNSKGDFRFEKALGHRSLLSGEKKQEQLDDIVFLASATKLLTTIAALACIDDGLLTLHGDLSQVMPELTNKEVLTGFSDSGAPTLKSARRKIDLEMLLTHSSGLVYFFLDPMISQWRTKYTEPGQNPMSNEQYSVEELMCYPLKFQPGEGWMYGTGLDWAGRIIERVTGKTLLQFLQSRILGRLSINDAAFFPVTDQNLRKRLVDLNANDPNAEGLAVVGGMSANANTKGDFGGHGMFMTVPDYLKVLGSILVNDGTLLNSTTIDSMFENHLSTPAKESQWKLIQGPAGAFFRIGTSSGSKAGHGLGGFLTLEDADDWYGERTLTWGGGMSLTWFIDRKNDLCGVCAIQPPIPADGKVIEDLKQTFRHDIYRKREQWRTTVA